MLNLSTLRTELASRLKNNTITNARRDRWLNLAQDEIARQLDPDNLLMTLTTTLTANSRVSYLEFAFNKISSVRNTTSNNELWPVSEAIIESVDPDESDSGDPYWYYTSGYACLKAQPSSASDVTIVSSSASDTTQKVRVSGIDSNLVPGTELITLNGLTPVVGVSAFLRIDQISKNSTTTGKVTCTTNSGAVTIVEIPSFWLMREYQPVYVFPTPTAADTIKVRGFRKPRPMINAEDYPDMPEMYHEAVLIAAVAKGHDDLFRPTLAAAVRNNELSQIMKQLKAEQANKRGKRSPVIGQLPFEMQGNRLPSTIG